MKSCTSVMRCGLRDCHVSGGGSSKKWLWRPWLFTLCVLLLQSGIILRQSLYIHGIENPIRVSGDMRDAGAESFRRLQNDIRDIANINISREFHFQRTTLSQDLNRTQERWFRDVAVTNARITPDNLFEALQQTPSFIEQTKRLQRVRDTCQTYTNRIPGIAEKVYVYETEKVAYCSTHKVASTYWMRVFRWLYNDTNGGRHVQSPLDISKYDTHIRPLRRLETRDINGNITDRELVGSSYRFLLTREPYARLWSVYIDKFVLPDNYFWTFFRPKIRASLLGVRNETEYLRYIAKHVDFRKTSKTENADKNYSLSGTLTQVSRPPARRQVTRQRCPTVSFHEFLQYIANVAERESGNALDDHFRPVHYGCHPCKFQPNYVGTIETMREDSQYLLHRMRLDQLMDALNPTNHVQQEIEMLIDFNFELVVQQHHQHGCIDIKELEMMLVEAFILNGYLPENSEQVLKKDLPLEQKQFKQTVLKLYVASNRTSLDISQQRDLMKKKAYEKIPLDLLHSIQTVFRWDFELFGYDDEPDDLFKR